MKKLSWHCHFVALLNGLLLCTGSCWSGWFSAGVCLSWSCVLSSTAKLFSTAVELQQNSATRRMCIAAGMPAQRFAFSCKFSNMPHLDPKGWLRSAWCTHQSVLTTIEPLPDTDQPPASSYQ